MLEESLINKSVSPKSLITVIILANNEEKMLAACINTVKWCQQVIVVDTGSTDKTQDTAKNQGAKVVKINSQSFAQIRTEALKHVKTPWVFYLDADERVTPALAREILVHVETNSAAALILSRENIFYGQKFSFGGWENDRVTRIFQVSNLIKWEGIIHESPIFEGESKQLVSPLLHFTHRSTALGLIKSASWTAKEAELLAESEKTPDVTFKLILRKMIMEFLRRAILKGGRKDGIAGLIESLIQAINRALVYIQVWEKQQIPSIEEQYQIKEETIQEQWKHDRV